MSNAVNEIFEFRRKPENLHDVFHICYIIKLLPKKYSTSILSRLKLNISLETSYFLSFEFDADKIKLLHTLMKSTNVDTTFVKLRLAKKLDELGIDGKSINNFDPYDTLNFWPYWWSATPDDYCDFKDCKLNNFDEEYTKFRLCKICMTALRYGTGIETFFYKDSDDKKISFPSTFGDLKLKKFISLFQLRARNRRIETNCTIPRINRNPLTLHDLYHLIDFVNRSNYECFKSLVKDSIERIPSIAIGICLDGSKRDPRSLYRRLTKDSNEKDVNYNLKTYLDKFFNTDDARLEVIDERVKIELWEKWYRVTPKEICDFRSLYLNDENNSNWSRYRLCYSCCENLIRTQFYGIGILPDVKNELLKKEIQIYKELGENWQKRVFP